ncbi:MAG TPA: hypothetical protein VFS39_02020 [Nitrospira sp.]|nr:hypothetical protein [Nitrospira sp.]
MKEDVVISSLSKEDPVPAKKSQVSDRLQDALWRLERLEAQMQRLSELVRDHAEDVDRLVRIVAEDRNAIRRQLLTKHHERVRVRKHLRSTNSKVGLDS